MDKKTIILIIIFSIVIVAICGISFFVIQKKQALINQQDTTIQEIEDQMAFEKEQIANEFEEMTMFDGYLNSDIQNDSLQDLLQQQKQRVQDLLEELRVTKATDAKRIAELKRELAAVRAVMVDYVRQIDSLSVTNQRLTVENQEVRRENSQIKEQNNRLNSDNTRLSATVSRAAMLEVTHFNVTTLNKNSRKTRILGQVKKLQFDYTIGKNITCEPGHKTVYMRLILPNGELAGESDKHTFEYESSTIGYSLSQEIEYAGDAMNNTLYWSFTDSKIAGPYEVFFFVDGNQIGYFTFELKK